ncbi:MAG: hypothetical protein LBQ86_09260 [Holophagales bacterium]|jgi:hypothetical protein|nr:hypothetical protein [Holophagales bacterium]
MKRPVWQFEIVRDTNAPFALARESLLNGKNYHLWHPRHRGVSPEIIEDGEVFEIRYSIHKFALSEDALYRVAPVNGDNGINGRLLLTYRNRFKGWPVILLMGWWRIRSERIWERFIEFLFQF